MTKKQSISAAADTRRSDEGFYCYIGPALPGVISHGQVLPAPREAALEAVRDAAERFPLIKTLIFPGGELASARLRAKEPGTALYENCRRLAGGR